MEHLAHNLPAFIETLTPVVNQYGYLGVGGLVLLEDFGLPTPGEAVLIAASFFAGLGHLNIILVFLVGCIGAILGDNVGFAIGNYGEPLIKRYGKYIALTKKRINKASQFFNRHGGKVIIIARFVEGLRQFNGIIAGLSDMRWRRFLSFNVIGAVLWVTVWSSVGYYGGNHIELFLKFQFIFAAGVGTLILAFVIYKVLEHFRTDSKHTH